MPIGLRPGEVQRISQLANGTQSGVYGLAHGRSSKFARGVEVIASNFGGATGSITVEGSPDGLTAWRVLATIALATPDAARVERSVPFIRINNGATGPADITITTFD